MRVTYVPYPYGDLTKIKVYDKIKPIDGRYEYFPP